MEDFYRIAELFRKFRAHTIQEDEVRELRAWLKTPGNRELFKSLLNGEREVEVMHELRKYNSDVAYRKLTGRIHLKKRDVGYYARVAAMFALPLVLGILAYWLVIPETGQMGVPVVEAMPVFPGQKKAVLTLDDGKKLALGNAVEREIISADGVSLQIDSSGLRYNSSEEVGFSKKNELFVPRKGEYNLILSDGTRVFLNSESRLIYPMTFGKEKREVILQGEGFFDVAKDTARPFIVKTDGFSVRVLGTSFNLKSYPGENRVEATLVQGHVKVSDGGRVLLLVPGEQACFNRKTGRLDKLQVNTALYTSWKDGLFVFERERLEDILIILSRWYDVTIFYQRPGVKDELFTGDLKRYASIDEHLKMLALTTDVSFEIHGNTIMVR